MGEEIYYVNRKYILFVIQKRVKLFNRKLTCWDYPISSLHRTMERRIYYASREINRRI